MQRADSEKKALSLQKKNEGFLDASQVQYVSRAGNFRKEGYAYTGTLRILKVLLSYDYLWMNIRVRGGAYGCMSGFTRKGDAYFTNCLRLLIQIFQFMKQLLFFSELLFVSNNANCLFL